MIDHRVKLTKDYDPIFPQGMEIRLSLSKMEHTIVQYLSDYSEGIRKGIKQMVEEFIAKVDERSLGALVVEEMNRQLRTTIEKEVRDTMASALAKRLYPLLENELKTLSIEEVRKIVQAVVNTKFPETR